jgi:hypothetical protein
MPLLLLLLPLWLQEKVITRSQEEALAMIEVRPGGGARDEACNRNSRWLGLRRARVAFERMRQQLDGKGLVEAAGCVEPRSLMFGPLCIAE